MATRIDPETWGRAISQLDKSLAVSHPEFVAKVKAEVSEADKRAHEALKQSLLTPRQQGICGMCGCDLDDKTPGCKNCWMRHHKRKQVADANTD